MILCAHEHDLETPRHPARYVKAELYAGLGIREYWLINMKTEQISVLRTPEKGGFREIATYADTVRLSPLALPGLTVSLKDLFE